MIFKEKHTPTHRLSRPFHARTGSLTRRFLITVQTLNFRILFSTTKVLSFRPTSNHLHLDSSFLTYLCVLQKSLSPKNELSEQQIHRTKSTFFYLTAGFRSADHLFVEDRNVHRTRCFGRPTVSSSSVCLRPGRLNDLPKPPRPDASQNHANDVNTTRERTPHERSSSAGLVANGPPDALGQEFRTNRMN